MSIARAMALSRIRRRAFRNAASERRVGISSPWRSNSVTAAAKLSSFAILERVLRDQFEIVEDARGDHDGPVVVIRKPMDVPCDTVGNPADPDASYNAHKGQGYMAQIVETYCEDDGRDESTEAVAATPDLITHVAVHKMTVHDGHRLADALDDLSQRSLAPAMMLGDSHYGSRDNMALTREQDIDLVAPARPAKGAVSGRLTLEDAQAASARASLEVSLSTKKAWSCVVPTTSNRLQPRSPKPSCKPVSTSPSAGNVRTYSDVPCKRPSVTANSPASNIPRPEPPTKSAGFMNEARLSAISTDGGPASRQPCRG